MRFGIFDHLERRPDVGMTRQYEERLQLLELADAAGFHAYHVAEHHHSPLCLAPNQAVYLSAAAQRTKQLRLGPLVQILPLYHPIRLIEEICMVDQISDGRYQVGIGPGTRGGTEFELWGGPSEENYARFEETLEILRKGLQGEYLEHRGRFYRFEHLHMELRPKQQPHPPFWWAGRAESAAQRAANYVAASSIAGLTEAMAIYRRLLEEVTRDPPPHVMPPAEPLYGGMKHIFIAETDGEARERALSTYRSYCSNFEHPGRFTEVARLAGPGSARRGEARPGDEAGRPRPGPASMMEPERALELEVFLAGSPATIRNYARRYRDVGANYFVGAFQWGDLTHEEASKSMRLFAQEVMPAFS